MAPGDLHGLEADATVKTLDVKFRIREKPFRDACAALTGRHHLPMVRGLLQRVLVEGEQRADWYQAFCHTYLLECLLVLLRARDHATEEALPDDSAVDAAGADDGVCAAVMGFIESHYAKDVSVQSFEEAANYSYRHLSHRFTKAFGLSPMRFLMRYRIGKAQELIRYSDYELKQIAGLVGFKNIHHFSRVFKEVTGTPPAQWRREQREGVGKGIFLDEEFTNPILVVTRESSGAPRP
jgi:AraC-like DNA-binding protein